jgi:hypothetical protein
MKDFSIKFLSIAKMEVFAPVSGGGVGFFAWAIKMAPVFSIIAAAIGIILGVLSYLQKRKIAKLEAEYYNAKINQFKNNK